MQWVGDRFFEVDGRWIDAASGRVIRLRLRDEHPSTALGWNDQCARLSRLRHPLVNSLLDFGAASRGVRFEAYDWPPGAVFALDEQREAAGQMSGFLIAQGIVADDDSLQYLARATQVQWPRLVGLVLQPRPALDALDEALERMTPPGPDAINVRGTYGLGLRTFHDLAARSARLRGFVPVGAAALAAYPAIAAALRDRHVCLIDEGGGGEASTAAFRLIAELSRVSTRRHVVVRLHRHGAGARRDLLLDRLSPRTLITMAYCHGPDAPTMDDVEAAAYAAEGRPGAFMAALCGGYPRQRAGAMTVHEAPARYVVAPAAVEPPVIAGRVLGSAIRAEARALALARRGRHAAAARVLQRGVRVLTGRHRPAEAAACALQLGWLALDRGRVDGAVAHFAHAAALVPAGALATSAAVGHGVALVDADRLVEAEAVLRGAIASADGVVGAGVVAAAAALVRCLFWQGRYHDALAVAADFRDSDGPVADRARLLAICARCEARVGRAAVRSAQAAQSAAAVSADTRTILTAELAWADVLAGSGDARTAQTTLSRAARLARAAHLPLFGMRVRIATARLRDDAGSASAVRRGTLPPLLARRLSEAAAARPASHRPFEPVAELERLLDVAQRAVDDRTALGDICRAVAGRLGTSVVAVVDVGERTLATEGRSWRPVTPALQQVITCGTRVLPDRCREPQEAAEPIRYGGQVIGAVACRWPAGSHVDVEGAGVVLRAAAMSVAAPVRAVLDTTAPPLPASWGDLLGESPAAAALRESALRAARAPFPVLIEGESGSGKELVARAVHRLGARRERKFCALNCAALTDDLVEAELFGHTRGAFTGAAGERAGLFEEADGGTVFLDEVGELSARAQAKLLRVLQEGEVRRVGENLPRRVDVRVVAATNRRLEDEVGAGRFRADLRFRLDVVRITVPPLRERVTDIPLLAAHFWREASARVGSHAALSEEALSMLARYDWPGNVRELQNVIAWIAVQSPRRGRVGPSALPAHVAQAAVTTACTFEAAREEFERRFIRAALAGANGRRSRAAEALGITRQGLAKMMRRLRIEVP